MNYKTLICFGSFIIYLGAMDNPTQPAHLIPPIVKSLPISASNFVKYTHDGKHLVSGTYYQIYVSDTQDYQTKWNPRLPSTKDSLAQVADVSSKDQIISTMVGKPISVWDITSEKSWYLTDTTKNAVMPVFNNEGDQWAAGNFFDDAQNDEIKIFDVSTNSYIAQIKAGALAYAVWNRLDNSQLSVVSGTVEGPKCVQIWDRRTDKLRHLADFKTNFCSVDWSNNGKLVIGCPGYFAIIDATKAAHIMYYNLFGRKISGPPASSQTNPAPDSLCFLSGKEMRAFCAAFYGNLYYCDFDNPSNSFDFPPISNPSNNNCTLDILHAADQLAVANFSLAENSVQILDISGISSGKKALEGLKEEIKLQTTKPRTWNICTQQ